MTELPPGVTRIAAYALCIDDTDRILLCRLAPTEVIDPGLWTMPGGGIDFGEDPADAVLRELEEESGLTGRIVRLRTIDSRVYPPNIARTVPMHAIRVIYEVEISGGALRDEVGGSTDGCAWLTREKTRDVRLVDLARLAMRLAWAAPDRTG